MVQYKGSCLVDELEKAIDESKMTTSIVHLPYSDDMANALWGESEGHAIENDGSYDYWGADIDGNEWRVRLDPR